MRTYIHTYVHALFQVNDNDTIEYPGADDDSPIFNNDGIFIYMMNVFDVGAAVLHYKNADCDFVFIWYPGASSRVSV